MAAADSLKKRKCEGDYDDVYIDQYNDAEQIIKQIVVKTKPITRIRSNLLELSSKLMKLTESKKDIDKYEHCILVLDSDEIHRYTWEILNDILFNNGCSPVICFRPNTLDDLLYILHKYELKIQGNMMSRLEYIFNMGLRERSFPKTLAKNSIYYKIVMSQLYSLWYQYDKVDKINIVDKLNRSMLEDIFRFHLA